MGHDVGNMRLWSNTAFVQILLNHYGINPCRENFLSILAASAATRPSLHEMVPQKQSGLLAVGDLLEEPSRTSNVGL